MAETVPAAKTAVKSLSPEELEAIREREFLNHWSLEHIRRNAFRKEKIGAKNVEGECDQKGNLVWLEVYAYDFLDNSRVYEDHWEGFRFCLRRSDGTLLEESTHFP